MKDWNAKTLEENLEEKKFNNNISKPVAQFLDEVKIKKWLRGGKKTDWGKVEDFVKKWRSLALKSNIGIPKKIKRLSTVNNVVSLHVNGLKLTNEIKNIKNSFYSNLISKDNENYDSKSLAVRSIQLTIIARTEELNEKKDGMAEIEYEILKIGGWLIGFNKTYLYVYFPFPSEIIMKKLKAKK